MSLLKTSPYLVLRLWMKKAKLDPTLDVGSAWGAQSAQLEDLIGSELVIRDLRASRPAVTFEREHVAHFAVHHAARRSAFPKLDVSAIEEPCSGSALGEIDRE